MSQPPVSQLETFPLRQTARAEAARCYAEAGEIERALAAYQGFRTRGFELVAVFDSDPKKIGLRANRRVTFFNGEIECRLLRYELYGGSKKQRKNP